MEVQNVIFVVITQRILTPLHFSKKLWLFKGAYKKEQIRDSEFNNENFHDRTVVHTAILEATKSWGKLRVNCDIVDSPNILYPITATPAYNRVQIPKLH